MPSAELLRLLLNEGRIVLSGPPREDKDAQAVRLLESAFESFRVEVAEPPIVFDSGVAVAAARLVFRAAWYLVSRAEAPDDLEKRLWMPVPKTPNQHLSADLLLRYLPQIHQRAKAREPRDVLTTRLAEVLRRWPLSGVLAEIEEGPVAEPNFGGHVGLMLLYAERLAENFKPAWIPRGPSWPYLELVWSEMGRNPSLLQAELAAE